ncbi:MULTISPECIES: HDOD domain-containing protein [Vibrio]|uniref:HDOD domain-containing protein n=1 Tax=Vibrio TaxID=662 RepID=UPI001483126B|nr:MULTISPECIES: HDOD domain-containing protein [Vibrio]MDQ2165540.1 HDOD domain-containing protein [Vibrio anguillarum]NNN96944.1 HDOD domain-containing protein [Vibrio sp. B4-6]NNN98292.1 HDOD domain-containing protein [Vibrio sp. B1-2]
MKLSENQMEKVHLKVMCIDDDVFMLKAIARLIRRIRPEWEIILVSEPLNWLSEWNKHNCQPPAIIISDLLMPHKCGDELLEEVKQTYPQVVRALLTGNTQENLPQKAHAYSHFVLPKPFTQEDFERLFECTERLYQMPFNNECRTKLGSLKDLPVLPNSIHRLQQTIASPTCDLQSIADTISHEPVLVARVFQIANSSYLGFRRTTDSLSEAVGRLGATLVESIAISLLSHHANSLVSKKAHQDISEQALRVSYISRLLAKNLGYSLQDKDRVFVSSLLTAIGKLILMEEGADIHNVDSFLELQQEYADYYIVTAYMLMIWGYGSEIGEIVLNQSKSDFFSDDKSVVLGSIVGLANRIEACRGNESYQTLIDGVPSSIASVLVELKPIFIE